MTAITMICFTLCVLAFFSLRGQGKEAAAERIPPALPAEHALLPDNATADTASWSKPGSSHCKTLVKAFPVRTGNELGCSR